MKTRKPPRLVPTQDLPFFFRSNGIAFTAAGSLKLGFGRGNDQYRLYNYSGPAEDETMGIFFELHTEDFFEVDSGPHVAIGLRGPVREDPHRGRGLAIGRRSTREVGLGMPWLRPIEKCGSLPRCSYLTRLPSASP